MILENPVELVCHSTMILENPVERVFRSVFTGGEHVCRSFLTFRNKRKVKPCPGGKPYLTKQSERERKKKDLS